MAAFTVFSVLNHSYSAPFGTLAGQVVLALVALLYAGGLAWLHRLGNLPTAGRFLDDSLIPDPARPADPARPGPPPAARPAPRPARPADPARPAGPIAPPRAPGRPGRAPARRRRRAREDVVSHE